MSDILPWLVLVLSAVAFVAWGFTYASVFEEVRYRKFPYAEFVIPVLSKRKARAAADGRKTFLEGHSKSLESEEPPRFELREAPPGIESDFEPSRELSHDEALAQAVGLRWQLSSDYLLLLGRAADAIALLARQAGMSQAQVAPVVSLRRVRARRYPFVVEIETFEPAFVRKALGSLEKWLGIGVVMRPYQPTMEYGRCRLRGIKEGVTGGAVESPASGKKRDVTCAHVLSKSCRSADYRALLERDTFVPDVALLYDRNPCFSDARDVQNVVAAAPEEMLEMARSYTRVQISRRRVIKRQGVTGSPAAVVTYGGRTHHFPHVHIYPHYVRWFDLVVWPPFANVFCREGDSGAWITQVNSDRWIGMVVGGAPGGRTTYVAAAGPLLEFLNGIAGTSLTPGVAIGSTDGGEPYESS